MAEQVAPIAAAQEETKAYRMVGREDFAKIAVAIDRMELPSVDCGKTSKELAEVLTTELKFYVAPVTVAKAALVVGVTLAATGKPVAKVKALQDELAKMKAEIAQKDADLAAFKKFDHLQPAAKAG